VARVSTKAWVSIRLLQQRDPVLADIPVIVVTACGARGDIDATAFFPKPCDFEEIVTTVAAHGRRYREGHATQPAHLPRV
jgi:DNA-binding response OmpR family regulator